MLKSPSAHLQKKIRIWIRTHHAQYGQLDVLVEDLLMQRANRINNKGIYAQVLFLLQRLPPKEIRQRVLHEMSYLKKRGMRLQHKHPGKTILYKTKKKSKVR